MSFFQHGFSFCGNSLPLRCLLLLGGGFAAQAPPPPFLLLVSSLLSLQACLTASSFLPAILKLAAEGLLTRCDKYISRVNQKRLWTSQRTCSSVCVWRGGRLGREGAGRGSGQDQDGRLGGGGQDQGIEIGLKTPSSPLPVQVAGGYSRLLLVRVTILGT